MDKVKKQEWRPNIILSPDATLTKDINHHEGLGDQDGVSRLKLDTVSLRSE